jgi:hypothetical protein
MRLPFRRKDKKKSEHQIPREFLPAGALTAPAFPPNYRSAALVAQLPTNVLERVFAFVCPHSRDESYETCEGSAYDEGCMLCDLRDLSHCAQVSRVWRRAAIKVL